MTTVNRQTILEENRDYWTGRASGYSEVSRLELNTAQRQKWKACLRAELARQFPDRGFAELRVLEVGTGPGFFAILLRELGCDVTAIDLTPAMLAQAKENAGTLAGEIRFMEMNAEALSFADASFDAVISRNLTWNLPHPEQACAEWARVLKPGGLLLNFDANWYAYLFDEKARAAYDQDRINSAEQGVWDQNVGENSPPRRTRASGGASGRRRKSSISPPLPCLWFGLYCSPYSRGEEIVNTVEPLSACRSRPAELLRYTCCRGFLL